MQLTADMRAVVLEQRLGYNATVSPAGRSNLSPNDERRRPDPAARLPLPAGTVLSPEKDSYEPLPGLLAE